jgi:predicted enzyme related to lactoylglutathione lyase
LTPCEDLGSHTEGYQFYKEVFNWPFYGENQQAEYKKSGIMLFEFQDPRISGGIVKVPEGRAQGSRE